MVQIDYKCIHEKKQNNEGKVNLKLFKVITSSFGKYEDKQPGTSLRVRQVFIHEI